MLYNWSFHDQFAKEFKNFPEDQQNKIIEFTDVYEVHGLVDFTAHEGKIGPSWKTDDPVSK